MSAKFSAFVAQLRMMAEPVVPKTPASSACVVYHEITASDEPATVDEIREFVTRLGEATRGGRQCLVTIGPVTTVFGGSGDISWGGYGEALGDVSIAYRGFTAGEEEPGFGLSVAGVSPDSYEPDNAPFIDVRFPRPNARIVTLPAGG